MMSDYAIFFDCDNKTYRLPVNPEEINTDSVQAVEKHVVLKLGQVAIPSHMNLKEFTFECEFPKEPYHYVETGSGFKDSDYYIKLFKKWRDNLEPIRFIASNGVGDDINTLVLMEKVSEVEKAGEEGDKYLSFSLLEYKEFGKKHMVRVLGVTATVEQAPQVPEVSPKANATHTVVGGDTLFGIAKKYLGNGNKYSVIFNANKEKIKNPNLIYPGQVLTIPKGG